MFISLPPKHVHTTYEISLDRCILSDVTDSVRILMRINDWANFVISQSRSYHSKIFAIFARFFLTWHPPKGLQKVFAKLLSYRQIKFRNLRNDIRKVMIKFHVVFSIQNTTNFIVCRMMCMCTLMWNVLSISVCSSSNVDTCVHSVKDNKDL